MPNVSGPKLRKRWTKVSGKGSAFLDYRVDGKDARVWRMHSANDGANPSNLPNLQLKSWFVSDTHRRVPHTRSRISGIQGRISGIQPFIPTTHARLPEYRRAIVRQSAVNLRHSTPGLWDSPAIFRISTGESPACTRAYLRLAVESSELKRKCSRLGGKLWNIAGGVFKIRPPIP